MRYDLIYNVCTFVSCVFELYLALSFYGAFHEVRPAFRSRPQGAACCAAVIFLQMAVNMQHENVLNLLFAVSAYLFIVLAVFSGDIRLRILHWIILIVLGFSSELVFSLLQSFPVNVPTNQVFDNEFFMVSSMLAVKVVYFILLSVVRQFSRFSADKLESRLFASYILIPVATLGIIFAIPYVRAGSRENTAMDFLLIFFYILLLMGNVGLFYMFSRYSKMKERQMLQEISRMKYEEKKAHYDRVERLDEKHKELLHNIDRYLRQIGIYADRGQTGKIMNLLHELQIDYMQGAEEMICANGFLNLVLSDFRERAGRENVTAEIFVENGFKIEFMKEIDVTAVFGNLLDNALEAAKKCSQGAVSISLFMQNGGALSVIRIENSYQGDIVRKEGEIVSAKKKGLHGIGIKNVQGVTDKYGGIMRQEFSDGVFKTTVVFPMR